MPQTFPLPPTVYDAYAREMGAAIEGRSPFREFATNVQSRRLALRSVLPMLCLIWLAQAWAFSVLTEGEHVPA
jgi:hypothetical protein